MKRIIVFILLLLPFFAQAQAGKDSVLILTKDSLRENDPIPLDKNWRYKEADNPAMADTNYDDSKWELVNPGLYLNLYNNKKKKSYDKFNSICWLRLHIYVDSAIVNIPLGLQLTHLGASEVYVDGKLMKKIGVVADKAKTEYYDPQELPVVFTFANAGKHVIAIRYANFDVQNNARIYDENFAGIRAKLGAYNSFITQKHSNLVITSFIFTLLLGIFVALGLSQLLLFFYNRQEKSNLYFSLFCFSLAILFFITWSNYDVPYPSWELSQHYTLPISFSVLCISLSGFINELFSKKKTRFIVICMASVVIPFTYFIDSSVCELSYFFLFVAVSLEAIILTVRAIYKKVRGAKIIGAGILLFALFIFITSVYASINAVRHADVSLNGAWLALVLAIAILSIPVSMVLYLAWKFAAINKDLKNNLEQVKTLSEQTIRQEQERKQMLETQNELLEQEVVARTAEITNQKSEIEKQHEELKKEKEKSDVLLLNILPEEVAAELKDKGHTAARSFNDVTVLFTDFVDFTKAGERMSAQQLVDELHICFKTFDEIISHHKIEKIKTIGDAYLAVSGLPVSDPNHAVNMINAALEIQTFMAERKKQLNERTFEIRLGIHSGGVVAGIVGIKKFAYDIWGDAVNTAARMEQSSEAGKINISQTTYELVKDKFNCVYRGAISAKNKGDMNMYFVKQ